MDIETGTELEATIAITIKAVGFTWLGLSPGTLLKRIYLTFYIVPNSRNLYTLLKQSDLIIVYPTSCRS